MNDHARLPDLITDVRSLLTTNQVLKGDFAPAAFECPPGSTFPLNSLNDVCTLIGESGTCPYDSCLAYSVNCANVGSGSFELVAPSTAVPSFMRQYMFNAVALPTLTTVAGGSVTRHGNLWKVTGLIESRLRGPISSDCATELTAQNCPVVSPTDELKDVCLAGVQGSSSSIERFDPDIMNLYDGPNPQAAHSRSGGMNCFIDGAEPGEFSTGSVDQGLAPGVAEIYPFGNSDNFLDITGVTPGVYWFEVGINLSQTYQEADYSNNIARVQVTIVASTGGT